jgi:LPS-assembly lipoprotein
MGYTLRLLAVTGLLVLTGCGFHLRGKVVLPEAMVRTELRGVDRRSELGTEIEGVLTGAGAQVVTDGEGAGSVLEIAREQFERRVASVDSSGKATQYELRYVLSGLLRDVEGAALTPLQNAAVTRMLNSDSENVLGTSSEEELLRREMQRDAVRQLIRQLRTALARAPRPAAAAPPATPAPTEPASPTAPAASPAL